MQFSKWCSTSGKSRSSKSRVHKRIPRAEFHMPGVITDRGWIWTRIRYTLWFSPWVNFTVHYYRLADVHRDVFAASDWYRLPTADVPFLVSLTTNGISYQLLTTTVHDNWTPWVLWLQLKPTVSRPVCPSVRQISAARDLIFITVRQLLFSV
jgi:hypothetical protein